jgi:hypothetical protein
MRFFCLVYRQKRDRSDATGARRSEDDGYEADISIDAANVPVSIAGSLEIEPREAGCVNHVRLTVDGGIPIAGKALPDFVVKACERVIAEEYRCIYERLDRRDQQGKHGLPDSEAGLRNRPNSRQVLTVLDYMV